MGEVYRATDTKLKRQVAIKTLPRSLAVDHDRLARFQREAEVLASLNHPHIAGIYGLEESAGVFALVMELVEGEDLSQRIARGAIQVDEALPIAKQIAEALAAAHEQGIIHRDLKPANIKVRADGEVKVLDFGLAKAMDPAGDSSTNLSMSPTITSPATMTSAGMILGTAAYMAPEQARGRPLDKRVDIWAFGCVLYEMLTGEPAFGGNDLAEILSRVLQREPDWTKLPAAVPARVRELLRLCLEKNVKNRRSDANDVRLDIEQALTEPEKEVRSAPSGGRISRLPWIIAASAVLAAAGLAVEPSRYIRSTPAPPELRLQLELPGSRPFGPSFALSPDGRYLVSEAGDQKLWLRAMDSDTAERLDGTEDVSGGRVLPFWSPDNRSIGFSSTTS